MEHKVNQTLLPAWKRAAHLGISMPADEIYKFNMQQILLKWNLLQLGSGRSKLALT